MSGSGTCRIQAGDWPESRCHQHLQQSCRIANAARDLDECLRDEGMFGCQQVKAVAHIIELLNFVQNRIRTHVDTRLSQEPKERKASDGLT
jgi:hypothetical protein